MAPTIETRARQSALRRRSVVQIPHWARGDESENEVENYDKASQRRRIFRDNSSLKADVLPRASTGADSDAPSGSLAADGRKLVTDSGFGDGGLGLFPSGNGNGIGFGGVGRGRERKGRQNNENRLNESDDSDEPDQPEDSGNGSGAISPSVEPSVLPPASGARSARLAGSPTPSPVQTDAPPSLPLRSSAFAFSPPSSSPTDSIPDTPENPQTPEATVATQMPRTTLTAALPESTDSTYRSQATEKPQPTDSSTSRSVLSLTPALTTADAVLSSEATKEPSFFPSKVPDATFTTSTILPSQTTSASESIGTAVQDGVEAPRDSGRPSSGDKALLASGSVVGVLILLILAWIVWRSSDRASARRYSVWQADFFSRDIFQGPRCVFRSIGNKIPFCKSRSAKTRSWNSLDDSYLDDALIINEKHAAAAAAAGVWTEKPQPQEHVTVNSYGIVLRTPINRDSMPDLLAPSMLAPPLPSPVAKQSLSFTPAQMNNSFTTIQQSTAPPQLHVRLSDLSSLSSGFGDGDIIMPPAAVVTRARSSVIHGDSITDDESSRHRDTICTEASEDSPPRFRTVSSWVRQQVGRVKRAERERDVAAAADGIGTGAGRNTELPLLVVSDSETMKPDSEEPRLVDGRTLDSGSAVREELTT